jgi:peptidoglycan/xylan/chitin deacetylase (PgdA/CDA1 family)
LKLKGEGVTFGSHSKTHPFLSRLSEKDVMEEVINSKSALEDKLQLPVEFFCYPYGDYDRRVIDLVKNAGYKAAFTTKRGLIHRYDDPFEIRRSFIRNTTNPILFVLRLCSDYENRKGRRK